MDWSTVTFEDVISALKEVDLQAPRPVHEFFGKFGPPQKQKQYTSRLKANLFYYRTNYIILAALAFAVPFLRNPLALLALCLELLGFLCFNDPFVAAFNDVLLQYLRKVNPRLAAKARAKNESTGMVAPSRGRHRKVYIVLFQRGQVQAALIGAGLLLIYYSHALLTLAWAIFLGTMLPVLHASFRLPNLKARLSSAREEFRAVWRGYQAEFVNDQNFGHMH